MAMTEIERNARVDEMNELSKLIIELNDNKALSDSDRWKGFQQGIALRGILMLLGFDPKSPKDEEN